MFAKKVIRSSEQEIHAFNYTNEWACVYFCAQNTGGDMEHDIRKLYQTYGVFVYRICWRFVKERQTALDLRQDVFLKLLRRPEVLDSVQLVKTWLCRVTMNHCLDFVRNEKKKIHTVSEECMEYHAEPMISSDADLIELREDFNRHLTGCHPEARQIIHLSVIEGFSHHEISNLLGVRRGVVSRRIRDFTRKAVQFGNFTM
jgi:RNA polymerase sigma-70 factor, ECF subfamily